MYTFRPRPIHINCRTLQGFPNREKMSAMEEFSTTEPDTEESQVPNNETEESLEETIEELESLIS